MHNHFARDDDHTGHQMLRDSQTNGSAYDRYLQSGQRSSFTSGEASTISAPGLGRGVGGFPGHSLADPSVMGHHGGGGPDLTPNGRGVSYSGQLPVDAVFRPGPETVPLPPDASNTLYVEGLPSDCTKRDAARILFVVMQCLVIRGGDPLILCFVDFENPACAATAMSALQSYKVDEFHSESSHLRLQFSRYPGPRSGPGPGFR
ncbi:hypothetical protein Lal_00028600, partial [Lupinus albus]